MIQKKIIGLCSLLAGLWIMVSSCENEISYDPGHIKPKLTMNAFIDTDSLVNTLYIELTGKTNVGNAGHFKVEVRVNGEVKEVLHSTEENNVVNQSVRITTRFAPGDRVRIDALTEDGEHHAWIEEIVPIPVRIEQIDTIALEIPPKPYFTPYKQMRIKIRFKDRPNEKNYYRIMIQQTENVVGETMDGQVDVKKYMQYGFWPWDDMALTDGRPATSEEMDTELFERVMNIYGVFDDSWFKDNEYVLNTRLDFTNVYFSFEPDFIPKYLNVDVAIRLLSITEAEYYYLNTLNIIDSDILEEYISDPVRIPSNVSGGTGFVGINSGYGEVIRMVEGKEVEYFNR